MRRSPFAKGNVITHITTDGESGCFSSQSSCSEVRPESQPNWTNSAPGKVKIDPKGYPSPKMLRNTGRKQKRVTPVEVQAHYSKMGTNIWKCVVLLIISFYVVPHHLGGLIFRVVWESVVAYCPWSSFFCSNTRLKLADSCNCTRRQLASIVFEVSTPRMFMVASWFS